MKKILFLAFLTGLISCAPAGVGATEGSRDKSAQTPKSENKPKQMPFRGKVSAVDKTTKVITLVGKEKSRSFQVTSETKITKNGKPVVLDDVTAGESVGGRAKENAAGKWEVVTLKIETKQEKAVQSQKKRDRK
jgi:hypothetical protein